jgi:hypothetical protein
MSKRLLFLLFLCGFSLSIFAQQTGQIERIYHYGGNREEAAGDFLFTRDGYILYGGGTTSTTNDLSCNSDTFGTLWLLKIDTSGNIIYSRCGVNHALFQAIATTKDSGCIGGSLSGYCLDSLSSHTKDLAVHKIDKDGNEQWLKCYGGVQDDGISSIDATSDGGYIFLADVRSNGGEVGIRPTSDPFVDNAWLVKIDSIGNIQWKRVMGGTGGERSHKVKEIAHGKYLTIITTISSTLFIDSVSTSPHLYSTSYAGNDSWLCIFDAAGNVVKQALLPWWGVKSITDFVLTRDGGYMMCGSAYRLPWGLPGSYMNNTNCLTSDSTEGDFAIFKLDSAFNIEWCWLDGGNNRDWLSSIAALSDTSFLAVGYSLSDDYNASSLCKVHHTQWGIDVGWAFSIDIHGNLLWEKCFSGSNNSGLINCLFNQNTGKYIYQQLAHLQMATGLGYQTMVHTMNISSSWHSCLQQEYMIS